MASLSSEIIIGSLDSPTYRYDNSKIEGNSVKGSFALDVLGNELSVDTMSVVVRYNPDAPQLYAPKGKSGYMGRDGKLYLIKKSETGETYLRKLPSGTPVWLKVSGAVFAKGYLNQTKRIARDKYNINSISGIGLLDNIVHVGGVYTGQTASAVLASIIGNTFSYTVSMDVAAVQVYGFLPYDTARKNLHTLLFAIGAALRKGADGEYVVTFLGDDSEMVDVPSSRIALQGRTEYTVPADGVEVTEHSFFPLSTDEVVTLFDNSGGAAVDNQLVVFGNNAPAHDITSSSNLTIVESGVNYAIVTGVGTLTGKKYTHNTQIIKVGDGNSNIRRVKSNTLVSFANSYAIGQRVLSYYKSAKTLDAKIMLNGEKPGNLLSLIDSFGDPTNAYLSKMDVLVTSVKGAQCKLVAGYQPGAGGNNYTNRDFFAADGQWVAQKSGQIRLILIGGGNGGQGGYKGMDGAGGTPGTTNTPEYVMGYNGDEYLEYSGRYPEYTQFLAEGGAAGAVGAKASYLVIDLDVEAGDVIDLSIGVGGLGGAAQGGLGTAGTPTTATCQRFGTKSSADGSSSSVGYYDPDADVVYAAAGLPGYKGGDGGQTDTVDLYAWHGEDGLPGQSVGAFRGGAGGAGAKNIKQSTIPLEALVSGGGGGGAAYGADGSPGGNAKIIRESGYVDQNVSGYGGFGADAQKPPKPAYGCGGAGGNGGGGGGSCGGGWNWTNAYYNDDLGYDPTLYRGYQIVQSAGRTLRYYGGKGGTGSQGGDGGDGCAIILS